MNRQDVETKVHEYRSFLHKTLRPQLEAARVEQRHVQDEVMAYQDLLDACQRFIHQQQQQQQHQQHQSSSLFPPLGAAHDINNNNNNNNNNKKNNNDNTTVTVDLGWNKVYCEAQYDANNNNNNKKDDPFCIAVDVGMGFHVELTLAQATTYCQRRIQFLQAKLSSKQAAVHRVQEHVTTAQDILDHLSNEALTMP